MMIEGEPKSFLEAMESVELEKLKTVISSELASLKPNKSFEFSSANILKTPIFTHMIFQNKLNEKGEVKRYKARLVAD